MLTSDVIKARNVNAKRYHKGGGGGVSKCAYFCMQPSSNFICLVYSPICLLYRVIHDFVQKVLFSAIQAIGSGWGNYV